MKIIDWLTYQKKPLTIVADIVMLKISAQKIKLKKQTGYSVNIVIDSINLNNKNNKQAGNPGKPIW